MVKKITLNAQTRSTQDEKPNSIRNAGLVPVVLYGKKIKPISLKVKLSELEKVYRQAGESHLVGLVVDGDKTHEVIIKDIQRSNLKEVIIHADFYQVDMQQKIEVEIPLHFIGEAKAEKELGGTLIKNVETVLVKCLPGSLVDFIEVDISSLNTFEDMIYFKDLKLSKDMELLNHADDAVVHVMEARAEAEPEPVVAAATEPAKTEAAPAEAAKKTDKK